MRYHQLPRFKSLISIEIYHQALLFKCSKYKSAIIWSNLCKCLFKIYTETLIYELLDLNLRWVLHYLNKEQFHVVFFTFFVVLADTIFCCVFHGILIWEPSLLVLEFYWIWWHKDSKQKSLIQSTNRLSHRLLTLHCKQSFMT